MALPADYIEWLGELKQRIAGARERIALAAKIVDRLSTDLRATFPDVKGLSRSNLKYMGFFSQVCPDRQFGQQSADQLPWFHILTLLTRIDDTTARV